MLPSSDLNTKGLLLRPTAATAPPRAATTTTTTAEKKNNDIAIDTSNSSKKNTKNLSQLSSTFEEHDDDDDRLLMAKLELQLEQERSRGREAILRTMAKKLMKYQDRDERSRATIALYNIQLDEQQARLSMIEDALDSVNTYLLLFLATSATKNNLSSTILLQLKGSREALIAHTTPVAAPSLLTLNSLPSLPSLRPPPTVTGGGTTNSEAKDIARSRNPLVIQTGRINSFIDAAGVSSPSPSSPRGRSPLVRRMLHPHQHNATNGSSNRHQLMTLSSPYLSISSPLHNTNNRANTAKSGGVFHQPEEESYVIDEDEEESQLLGASSSLMRHRYFVPPPTAATCTQQQKDSEQHHHQQEHDEEDDLRCFDDDVFGSPHQKLNTRNQKDNSMRGGGSGTVTGAGGSCNYLPPSIDSMILNNDHNNNGGTVGNDAALDDAAVIEVVEEEEIDGSGDYIALQKEEEGRQQRRRRSSIAGDTRHLINTPTRRRTTMTPPSTSLYSIKHSHPTDPHSSSPSDPHNLQSHPTNNTHHQAVHSESAVMHRLELLLFKERYHLEVFSERGSRGAILADEMEEWNNIWGDHQRDGWAMECCRMAEYFHGELSKVEEDIRKQAEEIRDNRLSELTSAHVAAVTLQRASSVIQVEELEERLKVVTDACCGFGDDDGGGGGSGSSSPTTISGQIQRLLLDSVKEKLASNDLNHKEVVSELSAKYEASIVQLKAQLERATHSAISIRQQSRQDQEDATVETKNVIDSLSAVHASQLAEMATEIASLRGKCDTASTETNSLRLQVDTLTTSLQQSVETNKSQLADHEAAVISLKREMREQELASTRRVDELTANEIHNTHVVAGLEHSLKQAGVEQEALVAQIQEVLKMSSREAIGKRGNKNSSPFSQTTSSSSPDNNDDGLNLAAIETESSSGRILMNCVQDRINELNQLCVDLLAEKSSQKVVPTIQDGQVQTDEMVDDCKCRGDVVVGADKNSHSARTDVDDDTHQQLPNTTTTEKGGDVEGEGNDEDDDDNKEVDRMGEKRGLSVDMTASQSVSGSFAFTPTISRGTPVTTTITTVSNHMRSNLPSQQLSIMTTGGSPILCEGCNARLTNHQGGGNTISGWNSREASSMLLQQPSPLLGHTTHPPLLPPNYQRKRGNSSFNDSSSGGIPPLMNYSTYDQNYSFGQNSDATVAAPYGSSPLKAAAATTISNTALPPLTASPLAIPVASPPPPPSSLPHPQQQLSVGHIQQLHHLFEVEAAERMHIAFAAASVMVFDVQIGATYASTATKTTPPAVQLPESESGGEEGSSPPPTSLLSTTARVSRQRSNTTPAQLQGTKTILTPIEPSLGNLSGPVSPSSRQLAIPLVETISAGFYTNTTTGDSSATTNNNALQSADDLATIAAHNSFYRSVSDVSSTPAIAHQGGATLSGEGEDSHRYPHIQRCNPPFTKSVFPTTTEQPPQHSSLLGYVEQDHFNMNVTKEDEEVYSSKNTTAAAAASPFTGWFEGMRGIIHLWSEESLFSQLAPTLEELENNYEMVKRQVVMMHQEQQQQQRTSTNASEQNTSRAE